MQKYHSNAKTNKINRAIIQQSQKPIKGSVLAKQFNVSQQTISKWRKRTTSEDYSSRPKNIHYSYSEIQETLIVSIRKSTWFSRDNICDMLQQKETSFHIKPSTIYNIFKKHGIHHKPHEIKALHKTFKEYEAGYVHIDVTYLPKIEGKKWYLFVAIDRATRTLYYKVYDAKTAENASNFFNECIDFFPFKITKVLTDNGFEFTNRFIKNKQGEYCKTPSKFDIILEKNQTEHRLTQPSTPQTNGMVERVNHTIKTATLLTKKYVSVKEMQDELNKFLLYYNTTRRHGTLQKQTGFRTPFEAVENTYKTNPELFLKNPQTMKEKLVALQKQIIQQRV